MFHDNRRGSIDSGQTHSLIYQAPGLSATPEASADAILYEPPEAGVTAIWETDWKELPSADLTRRTLALLPALVFGLAFRVLAVEPQPSIDPCGSVPPRVRVTATVSRQLYTVMIRFQQGAESMGDDPPPWALIEGSALDNATGLSLATGEVFPL